MNNAPTTTCCSTDLNTLIDYQYTICLTGHIFCNKCIAKEMAITDQKEAK